MIKLKKFICVLWSKNACDSTTVHIPFNAIGYGNPIHCIILRFLTESLYNLASC